MLPGVSLSISYPSISTYKHFEEMNMGTQRCRSQRGSRRCGSAYTALPLRNVLRLLPAKLFLQKGKSHGCHLQL